MDAFATRLLDWYDRDGRKDLPWHRARTPYRVWLSEVMLQQTQVATVIPYFERFVARFPDVRTLAAASLDEVLALWTGLGYYARARNLHGAARRIASDHAGELPADLDALIALPGIGRSTAGAILAAAFGMRAPILDGNVKRVLARVHAVPGYPGAPTTTRQLWTLADAHTPHARVADYTQAIMDLGALLCRRTKPDCARCPVAGHCAAHATDRVDAFPTPRPKRELPTRRARMFLLTDPAGRCLLERRPTTGLWGGLWTPPERDIDTSIDALLDELGYATSCLDVATMPSFRHTFTHFHLDIEPVRARLPTAPSSVAASDRYRWWSAADNEPIGFAKPALKLLDMLE
jgi:A/G-specific adenine glycosylase